jgi:hypothetical protein
MKIALCKKAKKSRSLQSREKKKKKKTWKKKQCFSCLYFLPPHDHYRLTEQPATRFFFKAFTIMRKDRKMFGQDENRLVLSVQLAA